MGFCVYSIERIFIWVVLDKILIKFFIGLKWNARNK